MNKVEADFKNALFVLMCVVAVVAVVFGLTADGTAKPDWALRDNRVYRGEIGLVPLTHLGVHSEVSEATSSRRRR